MTDQQDKEGPTVDELVSAFPNVRRDTLAAIRAEADSITYRSVADVLDVLADDGEVPISDYHARADNATPEGQTLDLDLDDPLDEEPDADPASPHNEERGREAMNHLRSANYSQKARRAVQRGTINDMIELLSTIDRWANEALLAPNRATLPNAAKEPMQTLASGLIGEIDNLAADGRKDKLDEVQRAAAALNPDSLSDRLQQKALRRIEMLENDGTEYEQVRDRIFNPDGKGHSIAEMRRLQREAVENADITYEQAQELIEDVTAAIERAANQQGES